MKIAIIGSRLYGNMKAVREFVNALPKGTIVISGGAKGVDSVAEDAAKKRGLETMIFPADWSGLGRRAGMVRNIKMLKEADKVIAFWDGTSVGSKNMIDACKKAGKPIEIRADTTSYTNYRMNYTHKIDL